MKKLLTTLFVGLLAVVSAFSQTPYKGTLKAGKNASQSPTEQGTLQAKVDGNSLIIWDIPSPSSNTNNPFGTEEANNLKFVVDATAKTAIAEANQTTGITNQFYSGETGSFSPINGEFNEDFTILTITSTGIIFKTKPVGFTGWYKVTITFDAPLTFSKDPTVELKEVTYDYDNTFIATLTTKNIDDPSNVKVKYGLSSSSLTLATDIKESGSDIVATFDLDLDSVGRGDQFDVYLQAEYNDSTFKLDTVKFTKPNGIMTLKKEESDSELVPYTFNVVGTETGSISEDNYKLIIDNFAGLVPLTFNVDSVGNCKVNGTPYTGELFPGTAVQLMYTAIGGSGPITGTIENITSTTSKLTINDWAQSNGESAKYKYFNTEINFDFIFRDLPIPEPTISIGTVEVTGITYDSAKITVNNVEYTGADADNVNVWVNVAPTKGEEEDSDKYLAATLSGTTATLTVDQLAAGTEYTVTVYAEATAGEITKKTDPKTTDFTTKSEPKSITIGTVTATEITSTSVKISFPVTTTGLGESPDLEFKYELSTNDNEAESVSGEQKGRDPNKDYFVYIGDLQPDTQYTVTVTVKATAGTETITSEPGQVQFTTQPAPSSTVNATGNMTCSNGSPCTVSAVYDAAKSKLTLTGVGGGIYAHRTLAFNVKSDGSLVSDTNQICGVDVDDDEDSYRTYDIYYSDDPVTSTYNFTVTGTAANDGTNCVLTLGDIGAYNTNYDGRFMARWNNTVITLNDLNLDIEAKTEATLTVSDVKYEANDAGYTFTVTVDSKNLSSDADITVSYTVNPTIENQSEVTENADGTYTFTLPAESLTAGTKYTVTVSASAGDVRAADVTKTFTASASGTDEPNSKIVTLTGTYTKVTSTNGYFVFDNNESNPFGAKFSLTYYSPSSSTGNYQKLGLYRANDYTQADGKYVFVVAGSIDGVGVVKPLTPSSTVNTEQNQMVFSYDTGVIESGLYEKTGNNTYQAMPDAVICVVECSMKPDPDNNNAPVYTVQDVKSVYKFLGGMYGPSLTQKGEFPGVDQIYKNQIQWVNNATYDWTFNFLEITDFHYGDVETLVESVEAADADARYFTLQGVEIRNPEAGTLCIKVSGNKATKVVIR